MPATPIKVRAIRGAGTRARRLDTRVEASLANATGVEMSLDGAGTSACATPVICFLR